MTRYLLSNTPYLPHTETVGISLTQVLQWHIHNHLVTHTTLQAIVAQRNHLDYIAAVGQQFVDDCPL